MTVWSEVGAFETGSADQLSRSEWREAMNTGRNAPPKPRLSPPPSAHLQSPQLNGRIVALAPLALEHMDALWEVAQDPRIWTWFPVLAARDRATFERWITEALAGAAAGGQMPFTTLDAESGRPIGSTRFQNIRPEHRVYEIGSTWLTPTSWGTGANAESKLLLLEHAFEQLGARRVEFKTEATNERSRAALAALPARFEGVFRKHMLVRDDESRDSAWYAVVDDDWHDVKQHLSTRVAQRASARSPVRRPSSRNVGTSPSARTRRRAVA